MNGISGTRSAFPVLKISGWDGPDDGGNMCKVPPPNRGVLWQVEGSVKSSNTAMVVFNERGVPLDPVLVTYENGRMIFPDGTKWKKRGDEPKDRRPRDMSTLGSGPKFRERDDDED